MKDINISTEQTILEAAEYEFLEKGFAGAKTTAIAKRAGVNHAMIHYYFETKENLCTMIYNQKVQLLGDAFLRLVEQDLSFFEKLKQSIDNHYNFLKENPRLVLFIYGEVATNEERKRLLLKSVFPKLLKVVRKLKESMAVEVERGTIRSDIRPSDLIMNLLAVNAITILGMPFIEATARKNSKKIEELLERRREENFKFIMSALQV